MTCIYYGTSETIIPVISFKPKIDREKNLWKLYRYLYTYIFTDIS